MFWTTRLFVEDFIFEILIKAKLPLASRRILPAKRLQDQPESTYNKFTLN